MHAEIRSYLGRLILSVGEGSLPVEVWPVRLKKICCRAFVERCFVQAIIGDLGWDEWGSCESEALVKEATRPDTLAQAPKVAVGVLKLVVVPGLVGSEVTVALLIGKAAMLVDGE